MKQLHSNFISKNSLLFFKEFLRSPFTVGSICPSSTLLTKQLVTAIPAHCQGMIIDLGAGTGIVTEQLLTCGYPETKVVAIEKSSELASVISRRWPKIQVINNDAASALSDLYKTGTHLPVDAIISSLPLRVLPAASVCEIMNGVCKLISDDGCLIQYSYAVWMKFPLQDYGLHPDGSTFVLGNLPPAKVERYRAKKN